MTRRRVWKFIAGMLLCTAFCNAKVDFRANSCQVEMKCDSEIDTSNHQSGKVYAGPPGKKGPKGEKGDSCECKTQVCPQSRFRFPNSNQVSDYIRFKLGIPDLDTVSACMWLAPVPDEEYTLISYATTAQNNMFIIMFQGNKLAIYKAKKKALDITIKTKTHLCVVVSEKTVAAYVNGVQKARSSFTDGASIKGGGTLVIGQEQDTIVGGFDKTQSFAGEIENLMMWYRILTQSEITMMYKNKCACAPGYSVALIPEWIQLGGSVIPLPTQSC